MLVARGLYNASGNNSLKKSPYRADKNIKLASKQLTHLGKGNRIHRCKYDDVNAVEYFSLDNKRLGSAKEPIGINRVGLLH